MKMIRNRITGLVFPPTDILLARVERDRDFEVVEDYTPPAKPEPEVPELPVPLDVNQATAEQIAEVASGIGLATAQAIVERIAEKGPFLDLDDLTEVSGVGKSTVNRNRDNLTV